jgi:thiol:disulfide interchange protein DsbC
MARDSSILPTLLSAIIFMTCVGGEVLAAGGPVRPKEANYEAGIEKRDINNAIRYKYPDLPFDGIAETGVKGIYELQVGNGIIYYLASNGYLFQGNIWDGRVNLTQQRVDRLLSAKLKNLPLDIAVKIGDGKNIVIEFSDPDCPYCRKASGFFKERDDVTIYVFFSPLPFHKNAPKKAKWILCAEDSAEAYNSVMAGEMDVDFELTPKFEEKVSAVLDKHIAVSKEMGVRGTPDFYVNGIHVPGADIERIRNLIEINGKEVIVDNEKQ